MESRPVAKARVQWKTFSVDNLVPAMGEFYGGLRTGFILDEAVEYQRVMHAPEYTVLLRIDHVFCVNENCNISRNPPSRKIKGYSQRYSSSCILASKRDGRENVAKRSSRTDFREATNGPSIPGSTPIGSTASGLQVLVAADNPSPSPILVLPTFFPFMQ
jgi:hypothetical protein